MKFNCFFIFICTYINNENTWNGKLSSPDHNSQEVHNITDFTNIKDMKDIKDQDKYIERISHIVSYTNIEEQRKRKLLKSSILVRKMHVKDLSE